MISETKTFRQGKVVIRKSASFFLIKDALVGLLFSQFCTPGSGLTEGEKTKKKPFIDTQIRIQTSGSQGAKSSPSECTMHAPAHAVV